MGSAAGPVPSTFDYPADPEHLILSYHRVHDMIADADPTPLLRIYGDGRMHVHYPIYMQKAGDYELFLTQGEIQGLLASFEAKGLFTFDRRATLSRRQAAEAARKAASGEFFELSDNSHTVIQLHLTRYTTGEKSFEDFAHLFSWANLAQEAKLYPQVVELGRVAEAEAELSALLERIDLVEVD
jgi:hypothetical protein